MSSVDSISFQSSEIEENIHATLSVHSTNSICIQSAPILLNEDISDSPIKINSTKDTSLKSGDSMHHLNIDEKSGSSISGHNASFYTDKAHIRDTLECQLSNGIEPVLKYRCIESDTGTAILQYNYTAKNDIALFNTLNDTHNKWYESVSKKLSTLSANSNLNSVANSIQSHMTSFRDHHLDFQPTKFQIDNVSNPMVSTYKSRIEELETDLEKLRSAYRVSQDRVTALSYKYTKLKQKKSIEHTLNTCIPQSYYVLKSKQNESVKKVEGVDTTATTSNASDKSVAHDHISLFISELKGQDANLAGIAEDIITILCGISASEGGPLSSLYFNFINRNYKFNINQELKAFIHKLYEDMLHYKHQCSAYKCTVSSSTLHINESTHITTSTPAFGY